ncbi:hypothetical protein AMAG_20777 [Allomyces macrogynus ATCC 38327]|uniref:Uncharacterized protein n=1 Tax=Allomyces macrogynus (strain ATCC 38327) TaxID=578462 RepID=A0A0L0TFA5_ALLM3|nr:hypothetical protein AMAG_20777 [Allomyces macrogynus ATCC 38327]|eukprot:KNE73385.1 hypothetical protein AMAG_20777 [Allomyces macrogynus ATCC 38327]
MANVNQCTFIVGKCHTVPTAPNTSNFNLIMGHSFGDISSNVSDWPILLEAHRDSGFRADVVRQLVKDGKALVSREVVTRS